MKGFIIMLSVFLLTLSLVIAEEIYIEKVSDSLIQKLTHNSTNNAEDFYDVIVIWEEKEKVLSYFVNHKELEQITKELKSAYVCFKGDEITLFEAYLERAMVKIRNLPEY